MHSVCHYSFADDTQMQKTSSLDQFDTTISAMHVPHYLLYRLQRVQNVAAKNTVKASKSDHITPLDSLPLCTHSTSCQCLLEYNAKYPPYVTVPWEILVLNTCPKSCKFIYKLDNSVRLVTNAFFVYPLSKQKTFVKDPFHTLALEQTFIRQKQFTTKNLIQKGTENLSLCRALLNHKTAPSRLPHMSQPEYITPVSGSLPPTSFAVITVRCLHVLHCSCCCCFAVVVLYNPVLF